MQISEKADHSRRQPMQDRMIDFARSRHTAQTPPSVEMINNMNGTFANSYIRFQLALISGEEEEVEEERRKSRNKTLYQKVKNWKTELRNENEKEKKDGEKRNNTSYQKEKMEH